MQFEVKKSDIHGMGVFTPVPQPKNKTLFLLDSIKDEITVDLGKNKVRLNVLTRITDKQIGLKNLDSLPRNRGALFMDSNICTMSEMTFPLNIIWLDEKFSIIGFEKAEPGKDYKNTKASNFIEVHEEIQPYVKQLILTPSTLNLTKIGKKVNHSDNSNCRVERVLKHSFVVSKRSLRPGEEITVDYTKTPAYEQPKWGWK